MRSAQKSNRARGRGNRKSNGNNVNRVYDSSGPEGKVRGTPQQIIDKYLSLARDSQTAGDRVMAENFLQHAEHYQRILILATQGQAERRDAAGSEGDDETDGEPMSYAGEERSVRKGQTSPTGSDIDGTSGPAPQPESGIGGLTTIDPETTEAEDPLLVMAQENPAPPPLATPAQPRRRRRTPKSDVAETAEPQAAQEERSPENAAGDGG